MLDNVLSTVLDQEQANLVMLLTGGVVGWGPVPLVNLRLPGGLRRDKTIPGEKLT